MRRPVDHRRIQRTIFRLGHDPGLAERVFAREPEAIASTGLSASDLELLLGAGLAGVGADAGGKRRAQLLRNAGAEVALTAAWAESSGADPHLLGTFTSASTFHRCVAEDGRLPLALAEHAIERAGATGDRLLVAIARLEAALARARRGDFAREPPMRRGLALAPRAEVLDLPAGCLDAAAVIRSALDAGVPAPGVLALESSSAIEHVLVAGVGDVSRLRLREVSVELLAGLAGALLAHARFGLSSDELATFCLQHDVSRTELDLFVEDLETDGLVVRG